MSLTIRADMGDLDRFLNSLGDNIEAAMRPAAQAGAQVLYEQVLSNVRRLRRYTGNLERSIYQAYSADNSGPFRATYHVSWNAKKAPHGILVEYGHLQRYRYYKDKFGNVRPMVRPGMQGKPPPKRRASQAIKDAYYVTLPVPIQVPARSFLRNATSAFPRAHDAMEKVLIQKFAEGLK